jgi:hypothetical protein
MSSAMGCTEFSLGTVVFLLTASSFPQPRDSGQKSTASKDSSKDSSSDKPAGGDAGDDQGNKGGPGTSIEAEMFA